MQKFIFFSYIFVIVQILGCKTIPITEKIKDISEPVLDNFSKIANKVKTNISGLVDEFKKIKKPYARKVQILTVGEQRAKDMGKTEVVSIFKKGKLALKRKHNASNRTG